MIGMKDATADPKQLVATVYDGIVDAYLDRYATPSVRQKWFQQLTDGLPASGGCVLDLGCGAGIPVGRQLAVNGHSVIGVDNSVQQIARAHANVPDASFMQADMSKVQLEAGRFDAVGAFYSITHIPAAEQGHLFKRIAGWLKSGGTLVASLGAGMAGNWVGKWLATKMFFSSNSEVMSLTLLRNTGLFIKSAEVEQQDNEETSFLWVIAKKPLAVPA